jgi:hypothetical protein
MKLLSISGGSYQREVLIMGDKNPKNKEKMKKEAKKKTQKKVNSNLSSMSHVAQ